MTEHIKIIDIFLSNTYLVGAFLVVAFVDLAYEEVDLDLAYLVGASFLVEAFQGEAYLSPSFQEGALVVSFQGDLQKVQDLKEKLFALLQVLSTLISLSN